MKINEKNHGFIVTNVQRVAEIGAELVTMRHERTGARLLWMNSGEENKLFSIAFKTVPWDDTGVFHILEHSVLGGSKRYPVKEPFLELMKSSMNTFLNAMTFPDKTVFPVSSRNAADFMNLTRVYLDAVFAPAIYDNPGIFRQEGWHVELRDPADAPLYKGVVFNEMKGALSSVYSRMTLELQRMLFPDNCYGFESGGDPVSIPNLTYEAFLDAHRTFYHPSNAYIYLDGDMDIDAVLALIDGEYLGKCDAGEADHPIPKQTPIAPAARTAEYALAPDEPEEGRAHIAIGKVLCDWNDREKLMALQVLSEVLAGSNDAPLKRALLDTGLCRDVSLGMEEGILQPFGVLEILNTDPQHAEALLQALREAAGRIADAGLDRADVEAALNLLEFRFREGEEPKGLMRNINALASWLYGGDPLLYIGCEDAFAGLRTKLDTGYYEALLREWLLDESGRATLTMLPSKDCAARERAEEEARLAALRDRWSDADRDAVIEANRQLDAWQQSVDTPEQLATMPQLPLSEVSDKPLPLATEVGAEGGVTRLRHPSRQKGIVGVNLYFSLADCDADALGTAGTMAGLLGELPTTRHDGAALQRLIRALLGDFSASVQCFGQRERPEVCRPYLAVQARFLDHNRDAALRLIAEILTRTRFDCADQVGELLMQADEDFKQAIIGGGHRVALDRARAGLSAESAVREWVGGFEAYKREHACVEALEKNLPRVTGALQALRDRVFARARLTASVTAATEESLAALLADLPEGAAPASEEMAFSLDLPDAQGILIPAPVSYSGYALSRRAEDAPAWSVAASILSLEYLWNEVRVKGGAYGAGASANLLGEVGFYSFRDPSPAQTLSTDRGAAAFLRDYCAKAPALDRYIISTIAQSEPLQSDTSRGATADMAWFRGITEERRALRRRQMLSVTAGDIAALCDALESPARRCVVGGQEALDACEGLTVASI